MGSETTNRKTGKIFATNVRASGPPKSGGGGGGGPSKAGGAKLLDPTLAEDKMNKIMFKNKRSQCFGENSKMTRMDAYIWAKTAGESDGRILSRGTYDTCLLKHTLKCDGQCGLIVNPPCTCSGASQQPAYGSYPPPAAPFPGYYQPQYHQPAYGG